MVAIILKVKKNTQQVKKITVDFISLIFTVGRAGGFHMLRC